MIPPSSRNAEEALLGAILVDEIHLIAAEQELIAEDFFVAENRDIFKAMTAQLTARGAIDYALLLDDLEHGGFKKARMVLSHFSATASPGDRVVDQIRSIKDCAIKRQYIEVARELATKAADRALDLVEFSIEAEGKTASVFDRKISISSCQTVKEIAHGVREKLMAGPPPAIETGFGDLNRKMAGGLALSELTILAARPGVGKSSLALSIALSAARTGERVGIYSMEMSKEQLMLRAAQQVARVQTGPSRRFSEQDLPRVLEALDEIEGLPIYIDDGPVTTGLLRAKAQRMSKKMGTLGLLIVDYLQLVTPANMKASREVQVAEISRALAALAHNGSAAVLALSQLSRRIESRENKRPVLSDLRESGSLEQDADSVMFIWRPHEQEDVEFDPDVELLVEKQRNGPTGPVPLTWHRGYCRFDSATREDFD